MTEQVPPVTAETPLTPEEAQAEMDQFFARLEDEYQEVPQIVKELSAERVIGFMKGTVSWAEMFDIPVAQIKRLTEFGYLQYRSARYDDAERVFKVLTMLQWRNSYFHSMLGIIYQQQKRPGEAIVELSLALDLHPHDGVSLFHRAEILTQNGWYLNAKMDLEKALGLPDAAEQPWYASCVQLYARVEQLQKSRAQHQGTKDHQGTA